MRTKERASRCDVWWRQGSAEPTDAGDAAPCPPCGVFPCPLSWRQTWGVARVAVGGTIGVVLGAAYLLN